MACSRLVGGVLLCLGCTGQPDPALPPATVEDCSEARPSVGRHVTAAHYARVASDLLGEPAGLSVGFPAAPGGWERPYDAQSVSPAHVEAWHAAAAELAGRLLEQGARRWQIEVEDVAEGGDGLQELTLDPGPVWWVRSLPEGGPLVVPIEVEVPHPGIWDVQLRAAWLIGFTPGAIPATGQVAYGEQATESMELPTAFETPRSIGGELELPAGVVALDLVFTTADRQFQSVALDRLTLAGPVGDRVATDSAARSRWVDCDTEATDGVDCAAGVIASVATAAWGRTPEPSELARLEGLVDLALSESDPVDLGLQLAVEAVLASPSFLLGLEDVAAEAGEVVPVPADVLARRLAVGLWGSIPDEALLACALEGGLAADDDGPCGLSAQIDRMMDDPRADALEDDFARQWLGTDELATHQSDLETYPQWNTSLAGSMADGIVARFARERLEGGTPHDLLLSATSWVDPVTAPIYGSTADHGVWRELDDRVGILGEAGVLTMTSHADRTSPTLRGQWILARLLCSPPSPPPENVPALGAEAVGGDVLSVLEAHAADPACAYCHAEIDPLGAALEAFDPLGQGRSTYPNGVGVGLAVELADGTHIRGQGQLASWIAEQDRYRACVAGSLATWATGAIEAGDDTCLVDAMLEGDPTWTGMLRTLASSRAFTHAVGAQ